MTGGYSGEEVGYISDGQREEAYPVVQYSREKVDPKLREVDRVDQKGVETELLTITPASPCSN